MPLRPRGGVTIGASDISTSKVRMAILSAGGKLAIFTSAGKVTCEVFNTRHPPDVTDKYAPDAGIGILGALVLL